MPIPASGYMSNAGRTNAEMKQAFEDITESMREGLGGAAATTLTISAGTITPTGAVHAVDTEAAAATDDLTNITNTNIADGSFVLLFLANASRNVVIKHLAGGTGQIALARGVDLELDTTDQAILLRRNGTRFDEVLYNAGSIVSRYQTKSSNYTVLKTDQQSFIRCSAALTLSLTAAATLGSNFRFFVYADGGAVTIDPNSSENINGATTLVIPDGFFGVVQCTGSAWFAGTSVFSINAFAAEASLATGDFFAIYDVSEGANNKATLANVIVAMAASQAQVEAGTDAAHFVTPQALKGAIGFSEWNESGNTTITLPGDISWAHGLSATPILVQVVLVNTTAEHNYSVGDEVIYTHWDNSASNATVWKNSTLVGISSNGFEVANKTSGARSTVTNANWRLKFRAWG